MALSPSMTFAAEGDYEAMLVSCIDPRMVAPVYKYMNQRGLTGQYSQLETQVNPSLTDMARTVDPSDLKRV